MIFLIGVIFPHPVIAYLPPFFAIITEIFGKITKIAAKKLLCQKKRFFFDFSSQSQFFYLSLPQFSESYELT